MNDPLQVQAFDKMGTAIMVALFVIGLCFFASGFRFINPFDTVFRFVFGSAAVAGAVCYYLVPRYRRHRLARMAKHRG